MRRRSFSVWQLKAKRVAERCAVFTPLHIHTQTQASSFETGLYGQALNCRNNTALVKHIGLVQWRFHTIFFMFIGSEEPCWRSKLLTRERLSGLLESMYNHNWKLWKENAIEFLLLLVSKIIVLQYKAWILCTEQQLSLIIHYIKDLLHLLTLKCNKLHIVWHMDCIILCSNINNGLLCLTALRWNIFPQNWM